MLLEPTLNDLTLAVADLQFNHSVLRQQARPAELTMRFLSDGGVEVRLRMERTAHGVAADGGLGDPVPASYVRLEPAQLLANATVAVDPTDGFPRYRLRAETVTVGTQIIAGSAYNTQTQQLEVFAEGQDWRQFLRDKAEAYILQDKYFGVMCRYEQVTIFDLLLAYAQQADANPSVFAVQP